MINYSAFAHFAYAIYSKSKLASERDDNDSENQHHDGSPPPANALEAAYPLVVVHANRLEGTPKAVGDVEPQSHKPDEIDHAHPGLAEGCLQGYIAAVGLMAHNLGQLHLGPELEQVQHQEAQHYDTQHEHVLRSPLHALGTLGDSISVVATGLAVLQGEDKSVDDVNGKTCRQHNGAYQSIPVGARNSHTAS